MVLFLSQNYYALNLTYNGTSILSNFSQPSGNNIVSQLLQFKVPNGAGGTVAIPTLTNITIVLVYRYNSNNTINVYYSGTASQVFTINPGCYSSTISPTILIIVGSILGAFAIIVFVALIFYAFYPQIFKTKYENIN